MTQQLPSAPRAGAPSGFTDFDRFFNRMMRGWPFGWPEAAASPSEPRALRAFEHVPNVEVKENGKTYTVSVELPGLDEKDVKASVEDDVLTISGEKKIERTDEKTHYSERSYGSFARSFSLPDDADRNAVSAKFVKGVLTVEIGKTSGRPAQGKQIDIKAS
jgi:HSP20 family protein